MSKIQQTKKELEEHLNEQLHFLEVSADSFDRGDDSEAKRMAVHIRTLLHDTSKSESLLKILGIKDKTVFYDSSSNRNYSRINVYDAIKDLSFGVYRRIAGRSRNSRKSAKISQGSDHYDGKNAFYYRR